MKIWYAWFLEGMATGKIQLEVFVLFFQERV
jgi:hypothetical protein